MHLKLPILDLRATIMFEDEVILTFEMRQKYWVTLKSCDSLKLSYQLLKIKEIFYIDHLGR